MKKIITLLILLAVLTSCVQAPVSTEVQQPAESAQTAPEVEEAEAPVVEDVEVEEAEAPEEEEVEEPEVVVPVHSNIDEFIYVKQPGEEFDINEEYFEVVGIESDLQIASTGGWVQMVGAPQTFPVPDRPYTIGVAMYFTFDEVAGAVLQAVKDAAVEMGVRLVINDANNDQTIQNEALENWLLQGVDGVLVWPADFHTVAPAIEKLRNAGIPVVAGNPPMAGEVDAINFMDQYEVGRQSGIQIAEALLAKKGEVSGKVLYGTLPVFHPNAVGRVTGFKETLDSYGGEIEYIEIQSLKQEEAYTKFQDALLANPDTDVAWAVMSATMLGILAAVKDTGSDVIIGGVDNDRPILAGIANGDIVGTIAYSGFESGYWALVQMVNLLNGVEIPGVLGRPINPVDKDNVEEMFKYYYKGETLEGYMGTLGE